MFYNFYSYALAWELLTLVITHTYRYINTQRDTHRHAEVIRMNKTVVAKTSNRKQKREKTEKASFSQIVVGMQKISSKTLHRVLRGEDEGEKIGR